MHDVIILNELNVTALDLPSQVSLNTCVKPQLFQLFMMTKSGASMTSPFFLGT